MSGPDLTLSDSQPPTAGAPTSAPPALAPGQQPNAGALHSNEHPVVYAVSKWRGTFDEALKRASDGLGAVEYVLPPGTKGVRTPISEVLATKLHKEYGSGGATFACAGRTVLHDGKPILSVQPKPPDHPSPPAAEELGLQRNSFLQIDPSSPPEFQREVQRALAYLEQSPTNAKLLADLRRGPAVVRISYYVGTYAANLDNMEPISFFRPLNSTVYFNPWAGAKMPDGSVIPPAQALAHELGHARQFTQHPTRAAYDAVTPSTNYRNKEEERNGIEVEIPSADELGLPIRTTDSRDSKEERVQVHCSACTK